MEATKVSEAAALEYAESIINAVHEPLVVLDQDLRVITAGRSFYEFFKVRPEETVGQHIYDLGNKQWDIPGLRELLENILPQKTTFDNYEVEHDFVTIGRRTMLLNARQIQRALGKERIILLAIEDITERKRLGDALAESEERFRRIFETASDGIVLLEKSEGKIKHANAAISKMFGYTNEESIGNKLQDIGIPLDMGDFQTTMQELNEVGIINYDNVPVKTKSGEHIYTDIYLVDRATLVQCNIREITERRQALAELYESKALIEAVVENVPLMIFLKEATDLRFIILNRAGEELLGYDRKDLIGKNNLDLFPPEQAAQFMAKDREVLDGEIDMLDIPEESILTARKGQRLLHTRKVCIKGPDGVTKFLLGISEDITERKLAEEQIKASLREKEVLIKEIHHRVKNNLNVVVSLLRIQSNKIENKEQARAAFSESCDRIYSMALVHQKLYEKADLTYIDMEGYIDDISPKLKGIYAPDRDITIESNAKDVSLDITLAVPVGLILNELITNSLKHAFPDNREGSITLSLSLKDTSYRLLVADNGIGLPEDISVDTSETFGMEIVYLLTGQIDGTLDIQRDEGTRFTITFPREDTEE